MYEMSDISQYNWSEYSAPLNDMQYFVLMGMTIIPLLLSCFGSSSIIYIARRKIRSDAYHRLLLIMSCIDMINLLWASLNPILMNKGNWISIIIGESSHMYSCWIFYYVLYIIKGILFLLYCIILYDVGTI